VRQQTSDINSGLENVPDKRRSSAAKVLVEEISNGFDAGATQGGRAELARNRWPLVGSECWGGRKTNTDWRVTNQVFRNRAVGHQTYVSEVIIVGWNQPGDWKNVRLPWYRPRVEGGGEREPDKSKSITV